MDNQNEYESGENIEDNNEIVTEEIVEEEVVETKPKSRREMLEAAFKEPKEEAEPAAPAPEANAAVADPAAPAAPVKFTAPQSWTPAAREKFASLPNDVKQEVMKRETEINRKLADTATERKIAQEFTSVTQPYEAHFRSLGIHPVAATKDLLNTGYILHTGSSSAKAQVIANLVKNFKIDINELDEVLAGVVNPSSAQPSRAPLPPELDGRLSAIEQRFQQEAQQREQSQMAEINTKIDAFANNPKNEFFKDVYQNMIGLLNSNQAQDLEDAYDQACWSNAKVRKVLLDRQQQSAARLNAASGTLNNRGPNTNSGLANLPNTKSRRELLDSMIPKDAGRI